MQRLLPRKIRAVDLSLRLCCFEFRLGMLAALACFRQLGFGLHEGRFGVGHAAASNFGIDAKQQFAFLHGAAVAHVGRDLGDRSGCRSADLQAGPGLHLAVCGDDRGVELPFQNAGVDDVAALALAATRGPVW